jgi:hypothetical protein
MRFLIKFHLKSFNFFVCAKANQTNQLKIANQLADIIIENSIMALLFDLLDEFEFKTRLVTIKLLNEIIINTPRKAQETIIHIPRGISRIIDLLNDSRDIIRYEVILFHNN